MIELAGQARVGELHGGHGPGQRVPITNGEPSSAPGRARPHQVEARVVDRATRRIEIGEEQVAIDESVQRRTPCALLEGTERLTSSLIEASAILGDASHRR